MEDKAVGVAAVERALTILNAFRPEDEALTLHDLSLRTGLHKSTILRVLASLMRFASIRQLPDGRYQLGHAVLQWATVYHAALRLDHAVLPILQQLAAATGEGASYFQREGDMRLCLYRVNSHRSIRDHMHAGDLVPLQPGAAGRVLVEFQQGHVPPPQTCVAVSIGEREPDIAAIAAPVFDRTGQVAGSISVSGPASRFTAATMGEHMVCVREAAATLTRRLGGPLDRFDLPLPQVA